MKWRRIASTKLFDHPRLTVYEDDVELPNGIATKYIHFGNMPDAGMVLARNNDGKFLIQKEYSYPPDEVLRQLPGGAIDENEDTAAGAARELAEESGLAGDLSLLGWFYHNNRRSSQRMYVYLATNLSETATNPDPEESFENEWCSESEIEALIRGNEIRNYTFLAGWAMYKATHGASK